MTRNTSPDMLVPIMRRSPKALVRQRLVEDLIGQTNTAAALTPADSAIQSVIDDPAYPSPVKARPVRKLLAGSASKADTLQHDDDPQYRELLRRVEASHRRRENREFPRILRRLFTAITRSGAEGPLQPDEIELPDPVSFRRLLTDAKGIGHVVDSPLRARLEGLYRLLDGLDLTRVRECPSCRRLFWARRKDQRGCSRPCANRIRVSKHYYKWKVNRDPGRESP